MFRLARYDATHPEWGFALVKFAAGPDVELVINHALKRVSINIVGLLRPYTIATSPSLLEAMPGSPYATTSFSPSSSALRNPMTRSSSRMGNGKL
jgi:hypothetical protein